PTPCFAKLRGSCRATPVARLPIPSNKSIPATIAAIIVAQISRALIANIFGRALHVYKMFMVVVIEQGGRPEPPVEPSIHQELSPSRSPAPKTDTDFERLLTPNEAAQFLRLSLSWLAKSRMRGDGPSYVKLGRSVRYREGDLVQWLKSRRRQSTSER